MAAQRPVLLVDDDPALIETLLDHFADDREFPATPAASIQQAVATSTAPVKNRRIRPTEKEAAILKYLYRTGNRTVTRQVLLNEVWGYNAAVTTHTLETHIYRLRQKIEPDPAHPRMLITESGGYRLD